MVKTLLKSAVAGGLVLFIWGAVSWMLVPGHNAVLGKFANEDLLADEILAQTAQSGVYILPNAHNPPEGASKEQIAAAEKSGMERMAKGPFVFVSVVRDGMGAGMGRQMAIGLLFDILAAGIAAFLLLRTQGLSYGGRVVFVTLLGVFVGLAAHVPYWNWWGFACGYTCLMMVDTVIGWFLAGLVLAKLAR